MNEIKIMPDDPTDKMFQRGLEAMSNQIDAGWTDRDVLLEAAYTAMREAAPTMRLKPLVWEVLGWHEKPTQISGDYLILKSGDVFYLYFKQTCMGHLKTEAEAKSAVDQHCQRRALEMWETDDD